VNSINREMATGARNNIERMTWLLSPLQSNERGWRAMRKGCHARDVRSWPSMAGYFERTLLEA
jgi:hypothetical protein